MYVPAHFSMSDADAKAVLTQVPTGDLVTVETGVPVATYLPFVYDPDAGDLGTLYGHVTRTNTVWKSGASADSAGAGDSAAVGDCSALVIVHGPDHYVSPQALPSTTDSGATVPTWDYVVVHAYGRLIVHDDRDWLRAHVDELTHRHEHASAQPWEAARVPGGRVWRMLAAAVGIEIPISRLVGKAKFSQNKSPADIATLIDQRHACGDEQGAAVYEHVSLPAAQARAATLAEVAARRGTRGTRRQ